MTPFERILFIHSVAPSSIRKAAGTPLSIWEPNDAEFVDLLLCSDGSLLAVYRWKDGGGTDNLELSELEDKELEAIIKAIETTPMFKKGDRVRYVKGSDSRKEYLIADIVLPGEHVTEETISALPGWGLRNYINSEDEPVYLCPDGICGITFAFRESDLEKIS